MAVAPITQANGVGKFRREPNRDSLIEKIDEIVNAIGSKELFSTSPRHSIFSNSIIHIHGSPEKTERAVGLFLKRIPDSMPRYQIIPIVDIDDIPFSYAIRDGGNGTCTVIKSTNDIDKLSELISTIFASVSSSSILIFLTPSALIEKYTSTKHCSFFTLDASYLLYPLTACVEKWLYRQYTKGQIAQSSQIDQHRCPIVLFKGNIEGTENTAAAITAAAETLLNRLFSHSPEEIGPLIPPAEGDGGWTKDLEANACLGYCRLAGLTEEKDIENHQTLQKLHKLACDENKEPYILIMGRYAPLPESLKKYISYIVSLDTAHNH